MSDHRKSSSKRVISSVTGNGRLMCASKQASSCVPIVRGIGHRPSGLARSKLINLFQGRSSPQAATRALVTGVVASWVGSKLSTAPGATSYDPAEVLARYLATRPDGTDYRRPDG
jgi:hypothetical protein